METTPSHGSCRRKVHLVLLNISFLLVSTFYLSSTHLQQEHHLTTTTTLSLPSGETCANVHSLPTAASKCALVTSACAPEVEGYIDYLRLFYCNCQDRPFLGYALLLMWLAVLFYLLGDTAATHFRSSLEGLSSVLHLSPTIAGVTLLSLGNGAPDVFSSVVSFLGTSEAEGVGLNSILGGAFFVSSVVMGVIAIRVGPSGVAVDRPSFVRDVGFLLVAIGTLFVIVLVGEISIWGAMGFLLIYVVYVLLVSTAHFSRRKDVQVSLLPISSTVSEEERMTTTTPLLLESIEPVKSAGIRDVPRKLLILLELPLCLPRRLTIPDVAEDRWSKPFAVSSATLAPILLVLLWNTHGEGDSSSFSSSSPSTRIVYLAGALSGLLLGFTALLITSPTAPPRRCLFPWLAGGFLMSVAWTYIAANELVSLLVSLGGIAGISPSVLGLTVLAWGNSLGDLIANSAMAWSGGVDGAQVAVSGCYAGPAFNTLVGLGTPLLVSAWGRYPDTYVVPEEDVGGLLQTMGFLAGGMLWAAVMVPARGMRPDGVVGVGLLGIYGCFLCIRVVGAV